MRATLRQVLWICLVLAVENAKARKTVTEEEKNSPRVNRNYDLCEDIQCLAIEDIFKETVDMYKMPCDNYMEYACSKNYTGSSDHEAFPRESNQILKDLMYILDGDALDELDTGNYALEIERQIFQHCKNREAFSTKEKEHYERFIMPMYHANRLENEYEYSPGQLSNWDTADLNYGLKGFGFAFFDVDIYQPADDVNGRYILLKPPSYEIISKLSTLLNQRFNQRHHGHFNKAFKKYDHLNSFIQKMVEITLRTTTEKSASKIIKFTVEQWTRKYDTSVTHKSAKIDWENYLSKLFGKLRERDARWRISYNTVIAIENEDYFHSLAGHLSQINDVDVIADYVHLLFVSKTIGLVDPNYRTYSILPQIEGLTCTPGLLAGTLYKYADKYFPAENRRQLEVMTLKVRDAVVERIQRAINGTNGSVGSLKLQEIMRSFVDKYTDAKIYFGYPTWLMNGTNAYRLYGTRKDRYTLPSFYDNQALIIEQLLEEKLRAWKQSNKPVIDLQELTKGLESSGIKVNIQTDKNQVTEILIPFGYFSEKNYKFFSSQLFDPINYGAAASEIAFKLYYELLDSILDVSDATIPRCVKEQVPDRVRDRDAYAKRAMAYSLALDTAYAAMPTKHSFPIQFVDFGAMADTDVFFLSFAKSLCSIPPEVTSSAYFDEKEKKKSYRIDDQYTLSYHIKFAMGNSMAFAENYLCKEQAKRLTDFKCDPLIF